MEECLIIFFGGSSAEFGGGMEECRDHGGCEKRVEGA